MIDLRSDTVTRPTEAMVDAMREATFGDDSRDGDATVQRLEALAAERMGKSAAAFMPSGTMANLVALLTHANRGGEVVLEAGSHTLNSELGGIAALAGLFYKPVPGVRGAMNVERMREAIHPRTRNSFATALVWVETTHNRAGGAVLPVAHLHDVRSAAATHGIPVHIDGARIFNAAAALGVDASQVAQYADSVCFCVSKALSAPVGSVLCGSADFIDRARGYRRMVGGNLRQAGPLAAAGIVALESMVNRLREDHATAKRLARGLHEIDAALVAPDDIETNIVRVELPPTGSEALQWSAQLKERGVLVGPCDKYALRFVTHRHIANGEVDAAIRAFRAVSQEMRSKTRTTQPSSTR
jgi:threonine aldolase